MKDLERFNSNQVPWPLESLTLEYFDCSRGCANVFQVIHDKFAETLISSDLRLTECADEEKG